MSLLSDYADSFLAVLESDAAATLIPMLQKTNNSIAANPTVLNGIAQFNQLVFEAQAEAPAVVQDELKELALFVNTRLQLLASKAPIKPA